MDTHEKLWAVSQTILPSEWRLKSSSTLTFNSLHTVAWQAAGNDDDDDGFSSGQKTFPRNVFAWVVVPPVFHHRFEDSQNVSGHSGFIWLNYIHETNLGRFQAQQRFEWTAWS